MPQSRQSPEQSPEEREFYRIQGLFVADKLAEAFGAGHSDEIVIERILANRQLANIISQHTVNKDNTVSFVVIGAAHIHTKWLQEGYPSIDPPENSLYEILSGDPHNIDVMAMLLRPEQKGLFSIEELGSGTHQPAEELAEPRRESEVNRECQRVITADHQAVTLSRHSSLFPVPPSQTRPQPCAPSAPSSLPQQTASF